MRILLIANGREDQTNAVLFKGLAEALAERHSIVLLFRSAPGGVMRKIKRLLVPNIRYLKHLLASDVLIVHTSTALNMHEILLGRILRRRIICFLWDVYPDSTIYMRGGKGGVLMWFFRFVENFCLRRADRVLIPTSAYKKNRSVAALKNVEIFPMWPSWTNADTIVDLPAEQPIKIAFAGQINTIRDVAGALEQIHRVFGDAAELHVFSQDELPDDVKAASLRTGIKIVEGGFLSSQELAIRLSQMHAGLISLSPTFSLPAFPSKLFSYLKSGVPILYHGPEDSDLSDIFESSGMGISVDAAPSAIGFARLLEIRKSMNHNRARFLNNVMLSNDRLDKIL